MAGILNLETLICKQEMTHAFEDRRGGQGGVAERLVGCLREVGEKLAVFSDSYAWRGLHSPICHHPHHAQAARDVHAAADFRSAEMPERPVEPL
jgi:hypothetical protein